VSWQLASFAILGAGLLAGFAWYERTRPDARIVALVGTLAAFAALGRIAFAAVPNVKPTTDIVLISGFALGGAPGYVVGAVAGLTSNFFFGQGPWTPWQMAGWGMVGVAGAVLARVTSGRIRRLPLAIVSFVLGFAFTALQDAGDWVNYSDHSLAQLGAYVGQGLGFDLVHAIGCFGFAMLFGPALIRTLTRFRTRIQVTWLPPTGATVPLLLAVAIVAGGIPAERPAPASAHPFRGSPIAYLQVAQNRDGGWGAAPGQPSDTLDSGWAAFALGRSSIVLPHTFAHPGWSNPLQYLARTLPSERGAGAIERTLLAVSTTPGWRRVFGGLRPRLERLVERNGSIGGQSNLTAFGILALRAAHAGIPARTVAWLADQQDRDGGFNFDTRGGHSDVDDTGAVLSALAPTSLASVMRRAVTFIHAQQNRDGGFGDQAGAPSNAQSTAFAICGLIAAGVDPGRVRRAGSPSAFSYLASLIQRSGAVNYARGNSQTPVWVTAEAEIAFAGKTL